MTVATKAFYVLRPQPLDAMAPAASGGGLSPMPLVIWGEGTPDGDAKPWSDAPKGSIWIQTDATADTSPLHIKAADNNADADWYKVPLIVLATASVLNITSSGGSAAYFH